MMGIPNWDNTERADRFREYVEIVDRMLANEQTTYEGKYYRIEGATVHRSVQSPRPPITIAAMGPRMMRYAATYADTWNTMSFVAEFEGQLAETADRISRMAGGNSEARHGQGLPGGRRRSLPSLGSRAAMSGYSIWRRDCDSHVRSSPYC